MLNKTNNLEKHQSETITFRIGKPILNEIRDEAQNKLKSINTLVNQIITTYIVWHKPAKKAGFRYFDTALVLDLINSISEEQIDKIVENHCKVRLKEIILMLTGENTFSSFIKAIIKWLDVSEFNYKYDTNGNFKTLIIYFNMGRKWSLFYKSYLQSAIEYYKLIDVSCEMTDNSVIIKTKY